MSNTAEIARILDIEGFLSERFEGSGHVSTTPGKGTNFSAACEIYGRPECSYIMFRIVRFKIPAAQLDKLIEDRPEATRRFYDALECLDKYQGFYTSNPMATTSKEFFIAEQLLRGLVGDPPHLIQDVTPEYKLLRTRAPQAYDYDYVIEIGRMQGESGEERLVAMPKERVNYQGGRYSSGLFTPVDCT